MAQQVEEATGKRELAEDHRHRSDIAADQESVTILRRMALLVGSLYILGHIRARMLNPGNPAGRLGRAAGSRTLQKTSEPQYAKSIYSDLHPECRARESSIILSNIVRAFTKLSFIETSSASWMILKSVNNSLLSEYHYSPFFWLYLSINLTIFGLKDMLERYNSCITSDTSQPRQSRGLSYLDFLIVCQTIPRRI